MVRIHSKLPPIQSYVISLFILGLIALLVGAVQNPTQKIGSAYEAAKPAAQVIVSTMSSVESIDETSTGAPLLSPGFGWNGAVTVAAPVGDPNSYAYSATAIAHFDVVPYQTFNKTFNVGVVAFHANDIANVSFSVNNGPWVAVKEMTYNPQTGVIEYWVTLDAATFAKDGPVEVRAIAYPNVGIPRILQGTTGPKESQSLFLNANAGQTLQHNVKYVSKNGNDANDCSTIDTPCATIARAINASSFNGTGSSVDGSEIRLSEGYWTLPTLPGEPWWTPRFYTENQWLTFTSDERSNPNLVKIDGIEGAWEGPGLWLKLVRLHNLTLVGYVSKIAGINFPQYIWFDHMSQGFEDPAATCGNIQQLHGWNYAGSYFTDVYMDNMGDGPRDAILARNVFANRTGGGHSSGTATVINYTVKTIYGSTYTIPGVGCTTPDYHGDVYFMYARQNDTILYNIDVLPGSRVSTRGIVVAGHNSAIINVKMDDSISGAWVFSGCGSTNNGNVIDHFVIKNSTFIGAGDWCAESGGGVAATLDAFTNNHFENTLFENGRPLKVPYPWNSTGIRYKNMKAMCDAGMAAQCGGDVNVTMNLPPVAVMSVSSTSTSVPAEVVVDASQSYDADGSISSYSWNFGDGSISTQMSTSHVYSNYGNYIVELAVKDSVGAVAKTSKLVSIVDTSVSGLNAPVNLVGKAYVGRITLSWTDLSNNEEGFYVERAKKSSSPIFERIATLPSNVRTYGQITDRGQYTYRVQAFNLTMGKTSTFSNSVNLRVR
ncbi:MAG TPA: PKD domain-containing protein [Acidobacteriota bacterium]|nr:PKD domain-containing protein [Acidobacteriota bacterium]